MTDKKEKPHADAPQPTQREMTVDDARAIYTRIIANKGDVWASLASEINEWMYRAAAPAVEDAPREESTDAHRGIVRGFDDGVIRAQDGTSVAVSILEILDSDGDWEERENKIRNFLAGEDATPRTIREARLEIYREIADPKWLCTDYKGWARKRIREERSMEIAEAHPDATPRTPLHDARTQIADVILVRIAKRYENCKVNIYPEMPCLTPVEAVLRCAQEEGFILTSAALAATSSQQEKK